MKIKAELSSDAFEVVWDILSGALEQLELDAAAHVDAALLRSVVESMDAQWAGRAQ